MSGGPAPGQRTPRATYRLQLRDGFGFAEAEASLPLLAELGVSHVYLSPILGATPGSAHGYDVVDPRHVDPALGGDAAFAHFADAAHTAGLGVVLDVVPNHMAVGPANPWWWDVLANGPASPFARYFDVDWDHPEPHLRERILLPVLEDHYGRVLEAGSLSLAWDGTAISVHHGDERFPLAPESLPLVLGPAAERAEDDDLAFLSDVAGSLAAPVSIDAWTPEDGARRARDARIIGERLAELAARRGAVADGLAAVISRTNGDAGALHRVLERQHYRLAWWRAARRDLGYRRFFDVSSLVGLRMEDPAVFDATHAAILGWVDGGLVDGLRVDHPDGLRDPEGYLARLRWAAPRAWIVVEKILEPDETMRRSWGVDGSTGYDTLNAITRLLVDGAGEAPLRALAASLTGEGRPFAEIGHEAKLAAMGDGLGSELARLTALLLDLLEGDRRNRDHTRHDLHEALGELLACLPVYRTYVRPAQEGEAHAFVAPEDDAVIAAAVAAATERRPDLPADLFAVIGELLHLGSGDPLHEELVARFQQLSGPVMAKGIEDTAFYRDLSLLALCEVGGDPGRWSDDAATFHARMTRLAAEWPATMVTTSTHDTKRSEDVRARLLVLSRIPDRWAAAVERWREMLAHVRPSAVDGHAEYLFLQTAAGAWPISSDRLLGFMEKGLREAKLRTSWTPPEPAYEAAVAAYVEAALAERPFVDDLGGFVAAELLVRGRLTSLVQAALRLTLPGVPDTYRGAEWWDLSLADPDNRRPWRGTERLALLRGLATTAPAELAAAVADPDDPGRPKAWLTRQALRLRARRPAAFGLDGGYLPLDAPPGLVAFARGVPDGDDQVVVIAALRPASGGGPALEGASVSLPGGAWLNILDGGAHEGNRQPTPVGELLRHFPVAILEHRTVPTRRGSAPGAAASAEGDPVAG